MDSIGKHGIGSRLESSILIPCTEKDKAGPESSILGSCTEKDRYYLTPLPTLPWSHEGGGAWAGLCLVLA